MGEQWDRIQFYVYKYGLTGFFVLSWPVVMYFAAVDVVKDVVSVFSTVGLIWTVFTAYLVYLSWGMSFQDFVDED